MKKANLIRTVQILFILITISLIGPYPAFAHCDTMNGPVVKAAQKAIETGNVNLVLIWVQKKDEAEVKDAFQKTLAVRKLNPQAKDLADRYFFETLVRIHRAGEGVPYTGLKPADTKPEPGIETADQAIEKGSVEELLKNLTETVHHGILKQYQQVMEKKNFKKDDVEAGREFVKGYVTFIHYVELLYQAAEKPAEGHYHEAEAPKMHEEEGH